MTQRNVLKPTVPNRMILLPKPACVIADVLLSKAQTRPQSSQAIGTSVLPASKTPVNQKSIILTPCTSTKRKLENEQRKNYRILISSC